MSTQLPNAVDPPLDLSTQKYDVGLLQLLSDQIQALGAETVANRLRGYSVAWVKADPDSASIELGTVAAIKVPGSGSDPLMVAATAANIAAGAIVFGVVAQTTPAGQRGPVAVGGTLPASITGLSDSGFARANSSTGKIEGVGDGGYGVTVGKVAGNGALSIDVEQPKALSYPLTGLTGSIAPSAELWSYQTISFYGGASGPITITTFPKAGNSYLIRNDCGQTVTILDNQLNPYAIADNEAWIFVVDDNGEELSAMKVAAGGGGGGLIVDADVDAAAAIDGSKIYPDFAGRDVLTTGDGVFGQLYIGPHSTPVASITSSGALSVSSIDFYIDPTNTAKNHVVEQLYDLTSVDATPNIIQLNIPGLNKTLWRVDATVIAVKADGSSHYSADFKGVYFGDVGIGSIAVVHAATATNAYGALGVTAALGIDNTLYAQDIIAATLTGIAATTISWQIYVKATQRSQDA